MWQKEPLTTTTRLQICQKYYLMYILNAIKNIFTTVLIQRSYVMKSVVNIVLRTSQ